MTLTDYMWQGKKAEEELSALEIALIQQYNDSKITFKKSTEEATIQKEGQRTKITSKQKWKEKQLYG